MSKIRIEDANPEMKDGVGPLPNGPEDLMEGRSRGAGSSSPSTGSGSGEPVPVSPAFAGDLIALPFEAAHIVNPVIDPLSRDEIEHLAEPFSEMLTKWGIGGKLTRAEVQFGFYLSVAISARVQAYAKFKKQQRIEAQMIDENEKKGGLVE